MYLQHSQRSETFYRASTKSLEQSPTAHFQHKSPPDSEYLGLKMVRPQLPLCIPETGNIIQGTGAFSVCSWMYIEFAMAEVCLLESSRGNCLELTYRVPVKRN